jgi:(2Fe-2S) ferredoxin
MGTKDKQVSLFSLQGQLLSFKIEDGYKIKGLLLATGFEELYIKLSKEARASVGTVLYPGDWLRVSGEKTTKAEGEEKLKAYKIDVLASARKPSVLSELPEVRGRSLPLTDEQPKPQPANKKTTILVCQKSDCMKRGGKAVCQALQQAIGDRQLTNQVTIRMTGCMKHCKAGPNVVMMPDKAHYSHITPGEIPALLDKHYPTPTRCHST